MAELTPRPLGVIACHAEPSALDAVGPPAIRVAPDELLVLVDPGDVGASVERVATEVRAHDADGVVLDATDGWSTWALGGDEARDAFARLSALALPSAGAVAGDVLGLPARVLVEPDAIVILVPSMEGTWWREAAERRLGTSRRQGVAP